ncbi:hypothetical protein SETIT_1G246600v2 [Setaria italica]|uniref:Uncharacterized protein n=2 Tax=Setaria italica TaxID=4555 RepID=A0A368PNW2_SETIT|nr:hypothetical protein SETIT_1G246600v2 [Setaria italica]
MKHLLLIPLLAATLPCIIGDATQLVYDTDGHELISNSSYYVLPVERGVGGGLTKSYQWRRCNFLVLQMRNEAKVGMAVRIEPLNASISDPVAVHLSTNVKISFDVITVCAEPMYWHVSDLPPFSTSQPRQFIAVGKDEGAEMPSPPSPDMLFRIERNNGAMKGYKLVSCIGTEPCKYLGLHAFKKENWLTTSASPFVVVFKKGHMYA